MEEYCIQLFTDPETERRLEVVASKRDVAVAEYCLEAIKRQLVEDEQLDAYGSTGIGRSKVDEAFFESLQALREKISKRRNAKPIDVDRIISQIRQERDNAFDG